jgi:hypothetical protein
MYGIRFGHAQGGWLELLYIGMAEHESAKAEENDCRTDDLLVTGKNSAHLDDVCPGGNWCQ